MTGRPASESVAARVRDLARAGRSPREIRAALRRVAPHAAKAAVDCAILRARQRGELPPFLRVKLNPGLFSIQLPEITVVRIHRAAESEGVPPSVIVRRVLKAGVRHPELWESRV